MANVVAMADLMHPPDGKIRYFNGTDPNGKTSKGYLMDRTVNRNERSVTINVYDNKTGERWVKNLTQGPDGRWYGKQSYSPPPGSTAQHAAPEDVIADELEPGYLFGVNHARPEGVPAHLDDLRGYTYFWVTKI